MLDGIHRFLGLAQITRFSQYLVYKRRVVRHAFSNVVGNKDSVIERCLLGKRRIVKLVENTPYNKLLTTKRKCPPKRHIFIKQLLSCIFSKYRIIGLVIIR